MAEGYGTFLNAPVNPPYVYNPINGISNGDDCENKSQNGDTQLLKSGIEQLAIEIPELEPITTILSKKQALSIGSDTTRASTPTGRAPRTDGQRNMQDSTFSISGK